MNERVAPQRLDGHHRLGDDDLERFSSAGHCVVRGLASASEIAAFAPAIDAATMARRFDRRPLEQRDTYGKAFIQSGGLCDHSDTVREFVHSPRFASVAARLLGVDGVRLYHDQALYKEPGGGHTPWHQDQVYWPLDTDRTITMWMPLVDVPGEIGGMVFADGTHRLGKLGDEVIGDASHHYFDALIEREGWPLSGHAPFAAGDATFHAGWTLHSAPANNTDTMRSVMTVIYFADGARVGAVDHPARRLDQALWLGGRATGELADSPRNPVLWHRRDHD